MCSRKVYKRSFVCSDCKEEFPTGPDTKFPVDDGSVLPCDEGATKCPVLKFHRRTPVHTDCTPCFTFLAGKEIKDYVLPLPGSRLCQSCNKKKTIPKDGFPPTYSGRARGDAEDWLRPTKANFEEEKKKK